MKILKSWFEINFDRRSPENGKCTQIGYLVHKWILGTQRALLVHTFYSIEKRKKFLDEVRRIRKIIISVNWQRSKRTQQHPIMTIITKSGDKKKLIPLAIPKASVSWNWYPTSSFLYWKKYFHNKNNPMEVKKIEIKHTVQFCTVWRDNLASTTRAESIKMFTGTFVRL